LARPGCRIRLRFIPAYCPHLDPIERLWGLAHKHITHNRCYEKFADFSDAFLTFLREEVVGPHLAGRASAIDGCHIDHGVRGGDQAIPQLELTRRLRAPLTR
jgi:hypothetical protein